MIHSLDEQQRMTRPQKKEECMYNFRRSLYTILLLLVFFIGPVSTLKALDQSDPAAVTQYLLQAMQINDLDGILRVMDKDQQQYYLPFTPANRLSLEKVVKKDLEKIGKKAKVKEIRRCTTLSGKPGVAARVGKKGDEVYVVILSQEDNTYSFENVLTLSKDAYKELELVRKVK
jgi:hypothetical protein